MSSRPSWDDIGMGIAAQIAQRSLCSKSQVGAAVASADRRHWAMGYNGPPARMDTWRDSRCQSWCAQGAGSDDGFCPSVHAEINAISQSDRASREGGTFYTTVAPCWKCALAIFNSGVSALVTAPWSADRDELAWKITDLAQELDIDVRIYDAATQ